MFNSNKLDNGDKPTFIALKGIIFTAIANNSRFALSITVMLSIHVLYLFMYVTNYTIQIFLNKFLI